VLLEEGGAEFIRVRTIWSTPTRSNRFVGPGRTEFPDASSQNPEEPGVPAARRHGWHCDETQED